MNKNQIIGIIVLKWGSYAIFVMAGGLTIFTIVRYIQTGKFLWENLLALCFVPMAWMQLKGLKKK